MTLLSSQELKPMVPTITLSLFLWNPRQEVLLQGPGSLDETSWALDERPASFLEQDHR